MKLEHFFGGSLEFATEGESRQPSFSGCHTLLCGPSRSGKTSLLFQYAYNCCAANARARVLFICKRKRLDSAPLCLPKDADIRSEPYSRIFLRYLSTDVDIRKFCAGLPFLDFVPHLIIIDDFNEFFIESLQVNRFGSSSRARDLNMVKTLALARDTANFASTVLAPHSICELLISDTAVGDGPRMLYIFKRWLPQMLMIRANAESTFSLQALHGDECLARREVRYSIAQRTLKVEDSRTTQPPKPWEGFEV